MVVLRRVPGVHHVPLDGDAAGSSDRGAATILAILWVGLAVVLAALLGAVGGVAADRAAARTAADAAALAGAAGGEGAARDAADRNGATLERFEAEPNGTVTVQVRLGRAEASARATRDRGPLTGLAPPQLGG